MLVQLISTSAGWLAAAWTENGLAALTWPQNNREKALGDLNEKLFRWGYRSEGWQQPPSPAGDFPVRLENALVKYFSGLPVHFNFPVDLSWCTPFQEKVLQTIRQIPSGEVRSYSQVAAKAGYPRAARAVGRTAGANRTPIVIPCHRVTQQNGELGGFGGGLEMKKYLLALEAKIKENNPGR